MSFLLHGLFLILRSISCKENFSIGFEIFIPIFVCSFHDPMALLYICSSFFKHVSSLIKSVSQNYCIGGEWRRIVSALFLLRRLLGSIIFSKQNQTHNFLEPSLKNFFSSNSKKLLELKVSLLSERNFEIENFLQLQELGNKKPCFHFLYF